jgi:hypothetical protein
MKTCLDCRETKPLDEFPPASRGRDGRASYCRACYRVRSKASYRKRRAEAGRAVQERIEVPDGYKWCPDCTAVKPLSEFPRNKGRSNGRATYCKPCHNRRTREVRQRLYGGGREYHLQVRFGIGQIQVDRMLAEQDGKCAVCDKPAPEHVDHDHETGQVRGMLCFNCNQALGNVRDQIEVLERLRTYLIVRRPDKTRRLGSEHRPLVGLTIEASHYAHAGAGG